MLHSFLPQTVSYPGTTCSTVSSDQSSEQDEEPSEHDPLLSRRYEAAEYSISSASDADSTSSEREDDDIQTTLRKKKRNGVLLGREAWTRPTLIIAYLSLFLMAVCASLEGQTVVALSAYATSSFKEHSLLSTILAVQGVINAVVKAPMAKFAAAFGRFEAYCCCIIVYTLGYIQMAAAQTVQTYASAQIFYSTGATSLQILQQIFIADTTDLHNRALFTRLPDLPYLFTVWVGPWLADLILRRATWRWGFGIWAILLPLSSLPLLFALFHHKRRARVLLIASEAETERQIPAKIPSLIRRLWHDLDILGFFFFTVALSLILVPVSLAGVAPSGWRNPGIIVAISCGLICLVIFLLCETSAKLAPSPLVPLRLLKTRTVLAGCCLAFWYFMPFYFAVQPYLFSYLQVVHNMPVVTAGRITQTFGFMATVSAVTVSLFIRRTRRYKRFVVLGCLLYILGLISMMLFRTKYSSFASILGSQIILGAGGGIVNVSVQVGIQAASDPADVGTATALFLTALEMGGAVGAAIAGAVWTHSLPVKLHQYLPIGRKDEAHEIFAELSKALSYPMGSPMRLAVNEAYQDTMDVLMTIAVCVSLMILPLAFLMKSIRL